MDKPTLRNKLSPIDNLIAILTDEGTYIAFDNKEKRNTFISELSKASKALKEITE